MRGKRFKVFTALAAGIAFNLLVGEAYAQRYVRVGIGASLAAETQFLDVECESESPVALYGCGEGGDGAPLNTVGEFGATAGIELGVGYALGSATRVEFQVAYRPAVPFAGRANFLAPGQEQSVTADRSTLSGVIAVKREWPMATVRPFAGLRPFAGVGVGRVRHRLGETRMRFPRTETIVPGTTVTQWAWTVTAGLSRALSERTVLEVAWLYIDQGNVETAQGTGRVQWRDGSRSVALDLAPTRARLKDHNLGISVRYGW